MLRAAPPARQHRRSRAVRDCVATCAATFAAISAAAGPSPLQRFANVPEIPFVQGRPETVQLGIWQLDPENRWTPGDFTRASGWRSRFPTRLRGCRRASPMTARRASFATTAAPSAT